MFEGIIAFLKAIPEVWVLLISMVPFVELRGAIPVGAALGLPFYSNFALAVIGNMLPVPFILLLMPKILEFLAGFKLFAPFVNWMREKAQKHKGKIIVTDAGNDENGGKLPKIKMTKGIFIALMLFVGIPLPGTGAWCGSLIASLFNVQKRHSFIAVFLGVIISGVIMSLASYGVLGFLKIFI
jgi:uncharacterized membrane protein